jgi:hypothetical protein
MRWLELHFNLVHCRLIILLHPTVSSFQMCLEIPIAQKKQPAMGLPPNWTFAFARNTKYYSSSSHAHIPGLFIYHPEYETKTFRSIEAAVANVPRLRTYNQNVVTDFYNHIGIIARGKTKGGARKKKRAPRPRIINSPSAVSQKPKAVGTGTVLSPQDLYANRCKQCELCIKQDCGACWSCRTNRKQPKCSRRAVCLQKVCQYIMKLRNHFFYIRKVLTHFFLSDRCALLYQTNRRSSRQRACHQDLRSYSSVTNPLGT